MLWFLMHCFMVVKVVMVVKSGRPVNWKTHYKWKVMAFREGLSYFTNLGVRRACTAGASAGSANPDTVNIIIYSQ
jgi:hypothetical protein